MAGWVFQHLGGVALSPKQTAAPGVNDTGVIFNWHPLLMAIAFPLLMSEAVVAYKAPIIGSDAQPRCVRPTSTASQHNNPNLP
jgi:hypothetical protein